MSQTQEKSEAGEPAPRPAKHDKESEPTKMGDPPKHPLPEIDGNPFTLLLEPRIEKEKVRCEAWKDEVQNLLIFAGLFSAVVTAFIIESHKALKQDPSEVLLSRILTQLEGRLNGTDILTTPKFTPTHSDIRVNVLWFLRLIFSLTTVLVGIIALQWLREYLRPQMDLEPQIAFSLHHLNVESLDRWYLPQIFTALPLLLQLALVLFLVGVIEFLWSLNSTVAIPIAVAVGLSLSFLLWTTLLPTMQALLLFLPRLPWGNMPRSPCPYRSPQSWAFHQLVRPVVAVFLSTFGDIGIDNPFPLFGYRGLVSNSMILEKDRRFDNLWSETASRRQWRPTNLIFRPNLSHSWAKLGIAWLFQRDLDYMAINPESTKKTDINEDIRPVPMYDAVRAVISIGENGSSRDKLLAHHCVQPIVQCNKSDGSYMWYLSHLVNYWDLDSDRADALSVDALMHNNVLYFHNRIRFGQLDKVRNSVQQLFVNITRAMFANGAIRLDDIWAGMYSPLRYWNTYEVPDGQEQLLDILQSNFRHAATYNPDTADAGCTTYFSKVGMSFIFQSARAASTLKPTSPLFSPHVNILQSLASDLRDLHEDPEAGPSPDYLFFASFTYVRGLLFWESDIITTETGRDLILAILQYRERVIPRKDLEDGFYNLNVYGWKFDNDWSYFVDKARALGIVVPSLAQEPPADLPPLESAGIQEEPNHPSGDAVVEVLHGHHSPIRSSSKTEEE